MKNFYWNYIKKAIIKPHKKSVQIAFKKFIVIR